jgi:hypothetical protein
LVITAHFSGTKGVVVNKFDCIFFKIPDSLFFVLLDTIQYRLANQIY